MEDWFEDVAAHIHSILGRFSAGPIQKISDLIDDGKMEEARYEYSIIVASNKFVKKYS